MGEQVAGAADAALHFVHHEQQTVGVAELAIGAQHRGRHHPDAAFALDRLQHDGGRLGSDRSLGGLQIAERHLVETLDLRPEAVDVFLLAAGRDGGERPAVGMPPQS